jgi:predicted AAA+ superfamily ATPase
MEGSINKAALYDCGILRKIFNTNIEETDFSLLLNFENNNEDERYFNKRIRNRIILLAEELCNAESDEAFLNMICKFYGEVGVGKFGMFKAFRLNQNAEIEPVISVEHIRLNDLIGYEIQKKKLTDNTESFLAGGKANNVLLFGDSGTGKSSSIKALLNEYYDAGLRMIEIYKHQFKDLSTVINTVKDRNYKFIIYMDDLSFEEFEIEYKYLKAVIEGGLEKKPDNVLIYATSNRRHLVREKYSDNEERDDDLHTRDTVQEKLSLSARFGVSIYYGSPNPKEFKEIVKGLAKKNNITMEEDKLLAEANKWELSHGGLSGRCAQQFINYITSI